MQEVPPKHEGISGGEYRVYPASGDEQSFSRLHFALVTGVDLPERSGLGLGESSLLINIKDSKVNPYILNMALSYISLMLLGI